MVVPWRYDGNRSLTTKIGFQSIRHFCRSDAIKRRFLKGLYASFLKGQGHQGIFILVKGLLLRNSNFQLEYYKGTRAMTRGHGGYCRCFRENITMGFLFCWWNFVRQIWREDQLNQRKLPIKPIQTKRFSLTASLESLYILGLFACLPISHLINAMVEVKLDAEKH